MMKLLQCGIAGNAALWIFSLISARQLQIRHRGVLSYVTESFQGVPQGCVLSPILFMLYVHDIFSFIPFHTKLVMFADDIYIYSDGPSYSSVQKNLQESLNRLEDWSAQHKFCLSPDKTAVIDFSSKRVKLPLHLMLHSKLIPQVLSLKILGVIFSHNLTWNAHFFYLKGKVLKSLNVFRVISSPRYGARTHHLIRIANSTIRSLMEHGYLVITSACATTLASLEPLYNSAIRLATGLPRCTTLTLLRVEAQVDTIASRLRLLNTNFYIRQLALGLQSPIAGILRPPAYASNVRWGQTVPPLPFRFASLLSDHHIGARHLCTWTLPPAPWLVPSYSIFTNELPFQDKPHPPHIIQHLFMESFHQLWHSHVLIGTDASKSSHRTSIGIYFAASDSSFSYETSDINSIFTAEALALLHSVSTGVMSYRDYAFFTDSLSVLLALQNVTTKSLPIILMLRQLLETKCSVAKSIQVIWTPGHCGIPVNEAADCACQMLPPTDYLYWVSHADLITYLRAMSASETRTSWSYFCSANSFHHIDVSGRWSSQRCSSRRFEVLISRLRTRLLPTNSFLRNIRQIASPNCSSCPDVDTSDHFLLDCPKFSAERQILYQSLQISSSSMPVTLSTIIQSSNLCSSFSALEQFFQSTGRF